MGGAPKKKSSIGLIIGIVAGILLIGGAAAAAFWYFRSSGPVLAKYMPSDVEVYIEVPDIPKALLKFADVDSVDDKELDSKARVEDAIEGIANAFDVEKADAESLVKSISGIAIGVRNVEKKPEPVILISFSSASGVEKLLASERFSKDGDFNGGTKYEVERRKVDAADRKKMSPVEVAASQMELKGDKDAFVWFESKKILMIASTDIGEDSAKVMAGDKEGLTKNETFKKAKWESGAVALVYVDSDVIPDEDFKTDYFKDIGPFLGSIRFADGGMVATLTGELRGSEMPKDDTLTPAVKLSLADRLPDTTVVYMAVSSKSGLTGQEAEDLFVSQVKKKGKSEGKEVEKALEKLKDEYKISLATFYDAVGDEAVVGITSTDKIKLAKPGMEMLDELGLAIAIHVRDKEAAEKLLKVARQEGFEKLLESQYDIDKKDAGFVAKPKDDKLPTVNATFEGDYLLIAVGKKERVKEITSAFTGEGKTLKEDKAHAKAIAALSGKPHVLIWFDAGRAANKILDENKEIKDQMKEMKIPYKAIVLEGDDRLTSAIAVQMSVKDGTWSYKLEMVNPHGLAPLGALAAFRAKPSFDSDLGGSPDIAPPPSGGAVGIAECDDYVRIAKNCKNASIRGPMASSADQTADAWKKSLSAGADRNIIKESCRMTLDSIRKTCE